MKLYSVLPLLFLAGCSAMLSDQEIEADCFPAFNQEVKNFFKELHNSRAYVWSIGGVNDDSADTPFLVENGINGFLLSEKITSPMEILGEEEKLYFTGRVFKKWPSWGEYYIGGGRKNIKIEVFSKGNGYLVFDSDIPGSIKNELPNRCTFK
ncbi:hypothetical protein [Marinobacter daepoensis]|uniref:hypothetical protein n=1 Tax=Marinobacter daepoensis TaxID=262077 RepID=UPI0012ECAC0F|nr:hypothetical protein [Marinobacter daepoensis]